ncbi:MAG TPA: hypothetical protein VLW85_04930 [Myxococcales bacterium]|nr:hypothetical protein [Myxococcales bacterium]
MADNEHTIVGVSRVVCVVKLPSPLPDSVEDAHFLSHLPLIGHHGDAIVTMVVPSALPRLRKLGAEVTVIDNDVDDYLARVMSAKSSDELVAAIDKNVAKGKEDLAIAQAGGGGGKDKA